MPDNEVRTLRHLILYQYAKIIARAAFRDEDNSASKKNNYGFIRKTFRDLRDGRKRWSDIEREDWQLVAAEKTCAYCGSFRAFSQEHIVPRSLRVKDRCPRCPTLSR